MAIKKTSKKKVSKKKSARKAVMSIENAIDIVTSQSTISPACKEAVVNFNAAMRSLTAVNKKVIAFTGRFEKSLATVETAKTPKQKDLAKQRLAASKIAKAEVIADAKAKTKAANDAEKLLLALASLYNASLAKFQKEFARNAATKTRAIKPKTTRRRATKKKAVKK
jgi:hypothetical protein